MGMEMTSYIGLFDELEKIAEEQRRDITKDKFKRHLKAVGMVGLGFGLGTGSGMALKRALLKRKGKIADFVRKHPTIAMTAPAALGTAIAGTAALRHNITKRHFKYVEKDNDRSKQHNSQ